MLLVTSLQLLVDARFVFCRLDCIDLDSLLFRTHLTPESIVGARVNVIETVGAPVDSQHAQSHRVTS